MKQHVNQIISDLESLEVINRARLEVYYPRVRDRGDVAVLRDTLTEVIVLSSSDHVSEAYYAERKERESYVSHGSEIKSPKLEDNIRRVSEFGYLIRNKKWLDFGCGLGGMLDQMSGEAAYAVGLEPNRDRASVVASKGHNVVNGLDEIEEQSFDVVTLFHVLEHLLSPVKVLREIKRVLKPEGKVLVEVPHARDALFTIYQSDPYKRFTFWSEHLVLHTRLSLLAVMRAAGFGAPEIVGYQRYPLANHLHWLAKGKGGGHQEWSFLNSSGLHTAYADRLSALDRNDTLIATALS